ncbi:hypothetical protein [Massilia sp. IC2-476]|uniref:hypothetical protein n=1 Tax=Massilia sp. IC2-476 TaxID=2887199 RepID=UPI001D10183B|nr:hypothetical protein [Massilia sp. IC2-476]MCC2973707.1 hypothetical protein [Massilia sp. IC2-476]
MFENCNPMPRPRAAAADILALGWRAHRCWPAWRNMRRALAALREGGRAVLLVRAAAARPYGNALFPTDLSPASLESLRCALATLPRMRFTLLHVCRIAGEGHMRAADVGDAALDECRRRVARRARAAGQRFVAQAPSCDARLVLRVARQPWAVTVAAHAAAAAPDVLVLAGVGGGLLEDWRRRADLCTLLRRTTCDLLLLPRAHAA